MNTSFIPVNEICIAYQIGTPTAEISDLPGGLLHQIFYLKTTQGEYVVKCFNDRNVKLLEDTLLSPEKSQAIAALMQTQGVPTIVALKQNHHYLFLHNHKKYMVMPWIQGEVLPIDLVSENQVEQIGNLLIKIQQKNFSRDFLLPNWVGYSEQEWIKLLRSLAKLKLEIVENIETEFSNLLTWSKDALLAASDLKKKNILSHRDLDPKNVIWRDINNPIVLDWEYAGLIHPILDLLIVALNWSEVLTGNINEQKIRFLLKGYYQQQTDRVQLYPFILAGYKGYCLDWLIYNLKSLPAPGAAEEINQTLRAIHAVEQLECTLQKIFVEG